MCGGGGGEGEGDLCVVGLMSQFVSVSALSLLMARMYVFMHIMIYNLRQMGKALCFTVCFDIQHIHSLTPVAPWALAY